MYIRRCIACTCLLVMLGSCYFQDLYKMLCRILITLLFTQHQWQSWTRSPRSCTRSSWRRTSTCLPLCRSTRSSAPPTTSRRCFISPARHHSADTRHLYVGCLAGQTMAATLLYTCSPILFLHSAWPCF
jgi:hypothetical protein